MPRKPAKPAVPEAADLESLARAALLEVTPASTVGALVETRQGAEAGLSDVVFASTQPGYVGWSWVVTVVAVPDEATGEPQPPTVLELGLLPGDDALLAPEWVPWSVRLAEWEAQQAVLAAAGEATEETDGAEDDEDVDDSDADLDEDDDSDEDVDDELDDEDELLDDEDLDGDEDPDEDDEDPDADDEDDFDEDGPRTTHGGDIDGVDIDDLDDED